MTEFMREHVFKNGDMLVVEFADTYAMLMGLPLYSVTYMAKDTGDDGEAIYYSCNSEPYIDMKDAAAAFEARVVEEHPIQGSNKRSGWLETADYKMDIMFAASIGNKDFDEVGSHWGEFFYDGENVMKDKSRVIRTLSALSQTIHRLNERNRELEQQVRELEREQENTQTNMVAEID